MNISYTSLFIYLSVLLLSLPMLAYSQKSKTDSRLEKALLKETAGFRGIVGIHVMHLKSGKAASINADSIFPTASIVKIPILIGIFERIEKGELNYHQPMLYRDSIRYGGAGLMQFFKDSTQTELSILLNLMMTYSDNTTSLWNQQLAGGGGKINTLLQSYGLKHTRVNSRTEGREAMWKIYGWGQTTPREMTDLLVKIRNGEIISRAASEKMYRIMSKGYYDENALAQIPPDIHAAAKSGSVDASRSEVVLVNAPHGDYVFYIGTKENQDKSWTKNNEAETLIRRVSALIWNHFEPDSKWKPKG